MHAGGSDFKLFDGSDLKISDLEMVGPDYLALVRLTGVYLLEFF